MMVADVSAVIYTEKHGDNSTREMNSKLNEQIIQHLLQHQKQHTCVE